MIHFSNAKLIDPETLTDSPGSLTVENGLIQSINTPALKTGMIIDCEGPHLAPGFASVRTSRVTV